MESHEVLREVLKKISAKQVASDLGLSLSLIYKWAEPPAEGSGAKEEAKTIRNRWESLKSVTEGFVLAAESGNFKAVEAAAARPAE